MESLIKQSNIKFRSTQDGSLYDTIWEQLNKGAWKNTVN